MRLSGQFQACLLFFEEKISRAQKHVLPRSFARVKNCCLCCLVLAYFCFVSWFSLVKSCAREIFSSKKKQKKKQAWNCPDSLTTKRAFSRLSSYLNDSEEKLVFNSIVKFQFSYCSLVWMFCFRTSNNMIKKYLSEHLN